ncbi:MAG: shikimate dehydrogenase [Micavibrio sp.]|nr:shikimate dehydrogenase [Micavibrio sp.]
MKLAVLGSPISHSKSPALHGHWLAENNIQGTYEAIEIKPENLEHDFGKLLEAGYEGFNVTVPLKEKIGVFCDFFDGGAQATGAVNTIHLKDHKLYAYNTDIYGFQRNIEINAPTFNWSDGPAVILGAGGAARAAAYVLRQNNAPEIRIVNRTALKGVNLAEDFGGHFMEWEDREKALKGANILINATSLGMQGGKPLNINLENLPERALVTDIVYTPLMTPLLTQALERGNTVVTGADMFFYQAQKSFEIWTGLSPRVDDSSKEAIAK